MLRHGRASVTAVTPLRIRNVGRPSALERARAERDAKGALLAFMAHELRQPLMAIGGMASLMRDTALTDDQRDMLDVIQRGATGLNEIVSNVLDLARLEAGKLKIAASPFEVQAAVEQCIDLLAIRAAEKDLELVYHVDAGVPARAIGDAGRFRQVVINLVGNAIKYTERGSVHVVVTATPQTADQVELQVAVADTGPGIPPEDLAGLFEPFAVGQAPCPATDASTGLGLSICRQLVELMGGRCWVDSEVGRGSRFLFTIVVRPVAGRASAEPVRADLFGRRILVVDDSGVAAEHVVSLVEGWGGVAEAVANGVEALQRLRAGEPYDVMLIDRHMPGLDGRALASQVGSLGLPRPVPLVLMTTLHADGRERGAGGPAPRFAAYVSKPIKPARLREALGVALTASAAEAAARALESAAAPCAAAPCEADPDEDAPHSPGELANTKVVIADDDPAVRSVLERVLRWAGATVASVGAGSLALDLVRRQRPDVVVLDAIMPGMDGFEVCRRLKSDPATRLIPVVLATGLDVEEQRIRALQAGADDILSKPIDVSRLLARVQSLARTKGFTDRLEPVEAVIVAMARCIEAKDPNTHGHCERLADYAERLGARLGLSRADVDALRLAGIVHDIGKVAVPDAVLLKPGPLSEDEWDILRQHPVEGERICAGLASFREVLPIIRHHHERLDGQGYPDHLCGEDVPVTARVLQIVDIFDALTTRRPYRIPLEPRAALEHLAMEVDRGWRDPNIFAVFREMIEEELAESGGHEPALAASA